ncbi:UbiH/UbiF family hydroxylase [Halocynthiibacter namhaensis]|uniref:UbiH/UbiF family hydroxylase n=1 Tax=Halocynthiibacter namhaensis TaxID=1290553 RepID=UPI0005796A24|nr:UbiH/UbiF family hydroxylase [Halocynthiibacter namhaensis]
MERIQTDILISGGGIAGMCAAAAFGSKGYNVICVDPMPDNAAAKPDLRTTAFLQPSKLVLEAAGLWDRLGPIAAPLQVMRIVDAGGENPEPRVIKDFDAADLSDAPFGWNFTNMAIRDVALARIKSLPNVDFRAGTSTQRITTRESEALVALSDGTKVSAKLQIGADGRNSPTRNAVGISVKTTRYGQKAIVFCVSHAAPHNNISTEVHRSGGPFTLVPLPDRDGKFMSAIVWMDHGPACAERMRLPDDEFAAAATERSARINGELTIEGPRAIWPIITQVAEHMSYERTALIAEAAHVVPPIGAQGLNMSLGDLRVLLEMAEKHPLGSREMLDAYEKARHPEVRLRATGIDMLNRASMAGAQGLRDMRSGLLNTFYAIGPIRKTLMKAGLGIK